MQKYFRLLVITFLLGIMPLPAVHAVTLTFDDLRASVAQIPDGYGGFDWTNFWYMNPDRAQIFFPSSGFHIGTITPNNIAYNYSGLDGAMSIIEDQLPRFTFNSAVFTAGWRDNLQLVIIGYHGATIKYDSTHILQHDIPQLIIADYWDITKLVFKSSGGTRASEIQGAINNAAFVMDNFRFNDPLDRPTGPPSPIPEPATILLMGTGIAAAGFAARRKIA